MAQELRYDKGESTFDGRAQPDATSADLDTGRVEATSQPSGPVIARSRNSCSRLLIEQGACCSDGRGPPRVGLDPQVQFPEAYVRLLRYRGSTRRPAPGRTSSRTCGWLARSRTSRLGSPEAASWFPSAIRLGRGGRFGRETFVPEPAWLEAIVNAAIHRSYAAGGDHIRVELFDTGWRSRAQAACRASCGSTTSATRGSRETRASPARSRTSGTVELGEGVNRMYEEMGRAGLPEPVFVQTPASVRVTFLADPISARILSALPRGSERFVESRQPHRSVTTTEAIECSACLGRRPSGISSTSSMPACLNGAQVPKRPEGLLADGGRGVLIL